METFLLSEQIACFHVNACNIWALHGYKCAIKITVFLDVRTYSLVDRQQMFCWNPLRPNNVQSFDVLLTVHLSIILVINQLNAQILVL